jgi:hypothetical protein
MDKPETLATPDTQDTGQINIRDNWSGHQEWTSQRHWQHRFVLCLVYPVLPVSLACPFLMATSVISNVYLSCVLCRHWQHRTHKTQDKYTLEITEVAIKNGQARDTGKTGYTRHRTNKRWPLQLSLTCICPVSCVSGVASVSGLSILDGHFSYL